MNYCISTVNRALKAKKIKYSPGLLLVAQWEFSNFRLHSGIFSNSRMHSGIYQKTLDGLFIVDVFGLEINNFGYILVRSSQV